MTEATDQTSNPLREEIKKAIDENPVLLFMKGTPEQPACGFSARTVAVLQSLGCSFAAVNVLVDPRIRQELSALSNWPTIPQLFIDGELIGGCDIVMEMYQSGELQQALGLESAEGEEQAGADVAGERSGAELPGGGQPAAGGPVPSAPPLTIENRL